MITHHQAHAVLQRVEVSPYRGAALRKVAMEALDELPDYDWSGVYVLQGAELVLDVYVGAETDHTRIPVGRGVCGTAVAENQNQVIADVRQLNNYLACSAQTRAEIVVLIRDNTGAILGQIDIDGHRVGAFDASDETMLRTLGDLLAARWKD